MEEKTLFKLARAITDTGTDTVSSKGGTVTYRITSLKRKLVNGKVVSTSTPSCTLVSTSVSWATWGGVTISDGYLDVKINYSENTGSSRSTTLTFDQVESDNKINLTVTQGSGVTYTGYIEMVSNSLPLGYNKGDIAKIRVMAYLKGSDGSTKPETPNIGSAPDWCAVSIASAGLENHYILSLTALSDNKTGDDRSGYIFLTCGDANLSIPVTQAQEAEYWGIRFNPKKILIGVNPVFFKVTTNISGEGGSMIGGSLLNTEWTVDQSRHTINVYISPEYSGDPDILSWSCFDKDDKAFAPDYLRPNNLYFAIKSPELGSYTLTQISISTPPVDSSTPVLHLRFNPPKKYQLDLNFYWGFPT